MGALTPVAGRSHPAAGLPPEFFYAIPRVIETTLAGLPLYTGDSFHPGVCHHPMIGLNNSAPNNG